MTYVDIETRRERQRGIYKGRPRKRSLTETVILRRGWIYAHERYDATCAAGIAERCEVSVHALMPHLRSLVGRGDVEHYPASGQYRRVS